LQNLANELHDHFCDLKSVVKSHVPVRNALERVEIPKKIKGIPDPIKRPHNKRTGTLASQTPSTQRRLWKRGREDLPQPVTKMPQSKKGSQTRPDTRKEHMKKSIPDLNLPVK
jgi:hypothetical protein